MTMNSRSTDIRTCDPTKMASAYPGAYAAASVRLITGVMLAAGEVTIEPCRNSGGVTLLAGGQVHFVPWHAILEIIPHAVFVESAESKAYGAAFGEVD